MEPISVKRQLSVVMFCIFALLGWIGIDYWSDTLNNGYSPLLGILVLLLVTGLLSTVRFGRFSNYTVFQDTVSIIYILLMVLFAILFSYTSAPEMKIHFKFLLQSSASVSLLYRFSRMAASYKE